MAGTRVLVVDDSATVRARLREVLESDPRLEVVGEASNGEQAIALCEEVRPDVITMDMMLPVMNGLAATEYVMAHHPTPILIVSSSANRGDLLTTYDALAAGAVDVIEKPRYDGSETDWERDFLAAVLIVSRVRVIMHPRVRLRRSPLSEIASTSLDTAPFTIRNDYEIVAIGASTGGPSAIVEVLRKLPERFSIPIIIVLHIGASHAGSFVQWLGDQTGRQVRFGVDRELVSEAAGQVVMAPPDHHLEIRSGHLHLTQGPERHSCRPSVDVLFESVAAEYGSKAVACLLTGMGRDGAAGLGLVRKQGGLTIAQDEETCVLYGMPRAAVQLDAVEHILPLDQIGTALSKLAAEREDAR
jgi:two-component system, chemotaxis family, protein-glutamate methylesterase/glutaminase